jgi:hypothetical protein
VTLRPKTALIATASTSAATQVDRTDDAGDRATGQSSGTDLEVIGSTEIEPHQSTSVTNPETFRISVLMAAGAQSSPGTVRSRIGTVKQSRHGMPDASADIRRHHTTMPLI